VDSNGVWRYSNTKKEIAAFGVNYAPAFAHSFRRLEQLGLDHKESIKQDVYHFSRMGLDAYRVHIWETEITDLEGNLLQNKHLDTFDFLIAELKKRNIQILLTPLALIGNGYPDGATQTPGFLNRFDKKQCSRDPEAFKLQANYLRQLMSHINPYTGLAYKDDSAIIGIELNNEPYHTGTEEQTKEYIQTLIKALRSAGYKNPLFYNMSQNPYLRETYYTTDIDGFAFQWYPTGLGSGDPVDVNMLPYVDQYSLHTPNFDFGKEKEFKKRARFCYEFGASNIGINYIYPAIARALREAGFQMAAYFSYDPMSIAAQNTEYPKHFMNLAYTPKQATSLMIAAEAFRQIPLGKNFGRYPENNCFGDFRVNHNENLAELISAKKFYHSNTTRTVPPNLHTLEKIVGCGSSPIVQYDGSGAYFLDKLANGAWRLEVMPDAVRVRNPFQYKPGETAVVIQWNKHTMELRLPDLGKSFAVTPLNEGNTHSAKAADGAFPIQPGVYLLGEHPADTVSAEFHAPAHNSDLAEPYETTPPASKNELARGDDSARLFFSHGSSNKAEINWGKNFSVNANANIYGWPPKFVQFGYSLRCKPEGEFTKLVVSAKSLNDHESPVQVSLGMDDGSVFGSMIELEPKMGVHAIKLSQLKPVPLARYAANPSFLPALAEIDPPSKKLDLSRVETIRFTIGPGLTDKQKKERHGIQFERAWLEQ
jgi:hypothetical protein